MDADLVERLQRLLPVSWDNELDGRGEPTHAVLTFGEHPTQAMSMRPDDWMTLNELPVRMAELEARNRELVEGLKFYADRSKYAHTGPSKYYPLVEDEGAVARALLTKVGEMK